MYSEVPVCCPCPWLTFTSFIKSEQQQAKNVFCGLPLFHVNGQLVTGLMTWLRGDHVILGTPQGYRGVNVVKHFWQIVEHYVSKHPNISLEELFENSDPQQILFQSGYKPR